MVNHQNNTKESYELVKSMAAEKQDHTAINLLDNIGSPPWTNPRSFGKLRRIIRAYEGDVVSDYLMLEIGQDYRSKETRAAYFAGEEFSFVKFVGFNADGMAQKIALDRCCINFKIPFYLLQGKNDLLTTPNVTKDYFQKITAPSKEYILIDRSGHDPNLRMLEKQFDILKNGFVALVDKYL